jgi:hypothetical protein
MKCLLPIIAIAALSTGAWAQEPVANRDAPTNPAMKPSSVQHSDVAASGANSFTEGQAKKRIAKAGYRDVSGLTKDDAGLWKGTAQQNGKTVNVALDYKGNVTTN